MLVNGSFNDKVPIFSADGDFSFSTAFPIPGVIRCELVKRWRDANGQEIVTVNTELPDHVESIDGQTIFDVRPEQLVCES
jgi:hypothetical protein